MDEQATCALCGTPIGAGQAWMEADSEGARVRAHAECLYREQGDASGGWEPQEHSAL